MQKCATDFPEMDGFVKFKAEVIDSADITPFRTEWRIAADDKSIAGSVDFVGKLPDGTYCLMDWKRSKGLADNLESKYGKKAMYVYSYNLLLVSLII